MFNEWNERVFCYVRQEDAKKYPHLNNLLGIRVSGRTLNMQRGGKVQARRQFNLILNLSVEIPFGQNDNFIGVQRMCCLLFMRFHSSQWNYYLSSFEARNESIILIGCVYACVCVIIKARKKITAVRPNTSYCWLFTSQ